MQVVCLGCWAKVKGKGRELLLQHPWSLPSPWVLSSPRSLRTMVKAKHSRAGGLWPCVCCYLLLIGVAGAFVSETAD